MKKAITLLLAVLLGLALPACGNQAANSTATTSPAQQNSPNRYNISNDMSADEKMQLISQDCIGYLHIKMNPEFEL